ncbi:MAG: hypothetical protein GY810_20430 [Aureispira sp.]|nr:hypothetical protein [Aureispira sp.]
MHKYFFYFIALLFANNLQAQEIREYMDLQIHPNMHMVYSFFGDGLEYFDEEDAPKLKWKHQLKNVNYANFYEDNKGVRIFVTGALTVETIKSKKKARKTILAQIEFINKFAEEHSDKFVVAKTPEEVRHYVKNTDKTIFVHSIEGSKKVINSAEDAQFWADQGVAFVTLIHLVDSKSGGAAIKPGMMPALLNFKGVFKKKKKRGLKDHGREVIKWLSAAGIMTDLTHMSDQTRKDALTFMEEHNIPPIVTHDLFKPIQNHPRGIEREDILRIYKLGGFMSLPISGESLKPRKSEEEYKNLIDSLTQAECYCEGSIHTYKLTYEALQEFIEENVMEFYADKDTLINFDNLSEQDKVRFSIGFQSDFNGWLNHSRPVYGKDGCYEVHPDSTYEAIELEGMPHPGLIESHWNWLEKENVDISPVKRASERFLQVWEELRANKDRFKEEHTEELSSKK